MLNAISDYLDLQHELLQAAADLKHSGESLAWPANVAVPHRDGQVTFPRISAGEAETARSPGLQRAVEGRHYLTEKARTRAYEALHRAYQALLAGRPDYEAMIRHQLFAAANDLATLGREARVDHLQQVFARFVQTNNKLFQRQCKAASRIHAYAQKSGAFASGEHRLPPRDFGMALINPIEKWRRVGFEDAIGLCAKPLRLSHQVEAIHDIARGRTTA
mgnify:CR=1 FL=1